MGPDETEVARLVAALQAQALSARGCDDLAAVGFHAQHLMPENLILIADLNEPEGQEWLTLATTHPALAPLMLLVISPRLPAKRVVDAIRSGVAAFLDEHGDPDDLAAEIKATLDAVAMSGTDHPLMKLGAMPSLQRALDGLKRHLASGTLTVESASGVASLEIRAGHVVDAAYGDKKGQEALTAIKSEPHRGLWRMVIGPPAVVDQLANYEDTEFSLKVDLVSAPEKKAPVRLAEEDASAEPPPLRLLLVDDDKVLLRMYTTYLDKKGWVVMNAMTGREGLDKAGAENPDVIVSDVMMPDMDGWDFLSAVRSDHRLRNVPFLLLSAFDPFLQQLEAFKSGADLYLAKGSGPRQLAEALQGLVAPRRDILTAMVQRRSWHGQLKRVGIFWLLKLARTLEANGVFRIQDEWAHYALGISSGELIAAHRVVGEVSSSPEIAMEALLRMDEAQITFDPSDRLEADKSTPDETRIETLCLRLNDETDRTHKAILGHEDMVFELDEEQLELYQSVRPEKVNDVVAALRDGVPPHKLLATSDISPVVIESVVSDLVSKGIVTLKLKI
jgi:CheY-like chemotaxis protein